MAIIFGTGLSFEQAAHAESPLYQESRPAMGGLAHIIAYGRAEEDTKKALGAAFSEITRLEKIFSPYNKETAQILHGIENI